MTELHLRTENVKYSEEKLNSIKFWTAVNWLSSLQVPSIETHFYHRLTNNLVFQLPIPPIDPCDCCGSFNVFPCTVPPPATRSAVTTTPLHSPEWSHAAVLFPLRGWECRCARGWRGFSNVFGFHRQYSWLFPHTYWVIIICLKYTFQYILRRSSFFFLTFPVQLKVMSPFAANIFASRHLQENSGVLFCACRSYAGQLSPMKPCLTLQTRYLLPSSRSSTDCLWTKDQMEAKFDCKIWLHKVCL